MAAKIKLMRLGKMRAPYYRIVVADARTKRDGRAIEEIGKYHPKEDPSFIEVNGERAAYWLGVGAQPTEAVAAILKVSGDWQKFKGLPAPPPMLVAAPKVDKRIAFEAAAKESLAENAAEATTAKRKAPKKTAEASAPEASDEAAKAAEENEGGTAPVVVAESAADSSDAPVAEVAADATNTPEAAPADSES